MAQIIRTERSSVLWAAESTFGTMVAANKRFGIHDTVSAPDPEYRWTPFFGIGGTDRNRQTILKGPMDFRGSLPDIRIQANATTRSLLAQVLGRESGSSVLEGISATDGRVPSMTMQIGYKDTSNTSVLLRNYAGGKVNRATLSAAEGEELRLSLEEVMFLYERHNRSGVLGYDGTVTAGSDPGISAAGRYLFAGASILAWGQTLCRVRSFRLSIDNQLEYRYYLCSTFSGSDKLQVPNDIVEGKRTYKLEMELDLGDPSTDLALFEFVMNQGQVTTSTPTVGVTALLNFIATPAESSSNLAIVIGGSPSATNPGMVALSAKHDIPAPPAGLIPVTVSLDVNTVTISQT